MTRRKSQRKISRTISADKRCVVLRGQSVQGAVKGGEGLSVREIGEVIVADGFRQLVAPKSDEGGSFTGVQVQTLRQQQPL
jgi:hypothetical protein